MTAIQCRGARAMLGWTQQELARRAEVHPATVGGFEAETKMRQRASIASMRRAMEEAGIEFHAGGDRQGVSLPSKA